jgi:hypothetical protein
MKTKQIEIKLIAYLLAFIMLLQGCTVYKSVPITIEQAVQKESKVKVKTVNNEKFKFSRIGFEDGTYYGVKKSQNVIIKTPLDPKNIDIIKEKDKTLSTVLSIGIPVIIIGGILAIAAASWGSFSISGPILPPGTF